MDQQCFSFDNRAESISAFLHKVLDHLVTQLLECHHESGLLFKAKFILGELLNNAVKHSGTTETVFCIAVFKEHVTITKIDNGKPLPYLSDIINKPDAPLEISTDSTHQLYAAFKEGEVIFYHEEADISKLDISNLSEHMGLLIITKAADQFTYTYQEPVNTFKVTLNLG